MKRLRIIGIIPARYASTRFPGKPLVQIQGISMIRRVYEQAMRSTSLAKVAVATDDERILLHVREFGGTAVMTSPGHPSGTDRCREAVELLGKEIPGLQPDDVIINIQGDEPFLDPRQIDQLASAFSDGATEIATLVKKITNTGELTDPNVVKAVFNNNRHAMIFSRSAIPFLRQIPVEDWLQSFDYYKHIGIYGYRLGILNQITALKPSLLEKAESLEQLRWLENGFSIKVEITDFESIAIDSPADLLKITNKT
jgi:3-deoxy-manno-octulosonate cytidylyltransferase (CMP-KDO synthetase)